MPSGELSNSLLSTYSFKDYLLGNLYTPRPLPDLLCLEISGKVIVSAPSKRKFFLTLAKVGGV